MATKCLQWDWSVAPLLPSALWLHTQVVGYSPHTHLSTWKVGMSIYFEMNCSKAGRYFLIQQKENKCILIIVVGMHGFVDVKKCEGFEEPLRKMTIAEQRQSKEWTYYIAAEEIVWDYAPNLQEHVDEWANLL